MWKNLASSLSACFWPSGTASRQKRLIAIMPLLCALTLALPGCAALAAKTKDPLPPAPAMARAIVTDTHVCIPHEEAGELLLWIEKAEKR